MKNHILNRHGVKWPPGFFTGQTGCSCCPPPPPPPPPPANPPYYYAGAACQCWLCDGPAPCRWLLEVDSYANGSGACPSGTNCANNNGSFILEKVGGSEYVCKWKGPNFVTTTFIPSGSGCATCNNSAVAFWQFELLIGDSLLGVARLYDATSLIVQAEYIKPIAISGYQCSSSHFLPGYTAYYSNGEFVCCFENPSSVLVIPLF